MADWRTIITSVGHTHHSVRGVVGVVLVIALMIVLVLGFSQPSPEVREVTTETTVAVPALERAAPTLLSIPKLNLKTTFVDPLQLNADQTVEVPEVYDQVGWYGLGAAPGEKGAAVILGHVDSKTGPAVFFSLGQLSKGDEIHVTRTDGAILTFIVYDFERTEQEQFPTEKVYGPTTVPELRLVTCTGTFLRGQQRYTHNLVVYATLTETQAEAEVI